LAEKRVVVLGGGVGGLVASNSLRKGLSSSATVTLIERKKSFQFPPSYPWLMLGVRKPEQTERSLDSLKDKGIEVLNEEIVSLDIGKKMIRTTNNGVPFDYLVIALGAEYSPESIPGFVEYANHIYDLEHAIRFRDAIEKFPGGTVAVGISRTPFKCPAAPYEAAFLLEYYFRKKGVQAKIRFFTPEGLPLPSAGADVGNGTAELLKARGIDARFKVKLTEVRPKEVVFEDGSTISFDLLLSVPPHRCPRPVVEAGLTDQTGWIPVDPETMKTSHDSVYAVGDVASVSTPSGYVPFLPKAGVFAHKQAEVVSHNIAVEIKGKGTKKAYDGSGECFLMTGGNLAGFVRGTWYAKPHPNIRFYSPSRARYAERVLFEKYWMRHWF
jgi:sulfide:quinone oxidoreductase